MSEYIDGYTKTGIIPLEPVPEQEFGIDLSGESYTLFVYQRDKTIYADLVKDDAPVFLGSKALDRIGLKTSDYLPLPGQLWFEDLAGTDNPDYEEFGSRFILYYGEKI